MKNTTNEERVQSLLETLLQDEEALTDSDFQEMLNEYLVTEELSEADLSKLKAITPPDEVKNFFKAISTSLSHHEKIKKILNSLNLCQAQKNELFDVVTAFYSILTIAEPLRNKYFRRELLNTPTSEDYKKHQSQKLRETVNLSDIELNILQSKIRTKFDFDKLHLHMSEGITDIARQIDCNINFYEQFFYVTTKKAFSKYSTNYWTDCISLLKEVRSLAPHLFHLKIDFCTKDKTSIKQRFLAYEKSISKTVTQ